MNTIKIKLSLSGRVAALDKNFPLFQGQFANTLLNVSVPTAMLAADFEIQHFIGNYSSVKAITDASLQADLTAFVLSQTGRTAEASDVIFYTDTTNDKFYRAVYRGANWGFTEVPYFAMGNFAGTSVKIGVLSVARNGVQYKSKSYYMRYVKTYTANDGIEYAMYERKMPREFTAYEGQGQNAPTVIINVVNATAGVGVENIVTSQTCNFDVLPSTQLDEDEPIEPTAQEEIWGAINDIADGLNEKQDKTDYALNTADKTVVGAINEVKSTADGANARSIEANDRSIQNAQDIADIEAIIGTGENYIGTLTIDHAPTSEELDEFVLAQAGRAPQGNDLVIVVEQIAGATDKTYKYLYKAATSSWGYFEIPPFEKASNGTAGIVSGTYGVKNYNTLVNIIDGEIQNIYIKVNGNYLDIRDVVLGNKDDIAKIVNGTTVVAEALKATQDELGNNIVNTYMTQVAGATKQYVKDYAMPKEFNNAFVIKLENLQPVFSEDQNFGAGQAVALPAVDAPIGETVLGEITYTLGDVDFQLSKKNSFTGNYVVQRSAASTEQVYLKVNTYSQKSGGVRFLMGTEVVPINWGALNLVNVNITGNFPNLAGSENFTTGDKIIQEVIIIREASTAMTYYFISSSMFPSRWWLNTGVQVFEYGDIGELRVVTATPTVETLTFGNSFYHNTRQTVVLTITDDILINSLEKEKTVQFSLKFNTSGLTIPQNAFTVIRYTSGNETKYLSITARANSKVVLGGGVLFDSFEYCRYKNSYGWNENNYQALITINQGENGDGVPVDENAQYAFLPYANICAVVESPNIANNASGTWVLGANNWNNGDMDYPTTPIYGIGEHDAAFFAPATVQDREKAVSAGLFIVPNKVTKNGQNYWRFTCVNTPTEDISLNYYVVKGMGAAQATLFLCGVYAVPTTPTPPVPANNLTDENGVQLTDENGTPLQGDE